MEMKQVVIDTPCLLSSALFCRKINLLFISFTLVTTAHKSEFEFHY